MANLALFDLDHTLIPTDSDHEWGRFMVKHGMVDAENFARENDRFFADYKAGKLDIHAPADVPEWRETPGDPRAAITLDLLLRMSSGLAFREDYVEAQVSDVIEMLFGKGKADVGHFAASFPLEHEPGRFWSYSSGTTNIISRIAARAAGVSGADFEAFMRRRLLDPIGMTSAQPKFDEAGTFIGSSFCYATPRDFARFGLLYLRDGVWDGQRLLPEGWVDYARRPTWQQTR